jgi:DNA-binding LacI/PurR family transcriptional regulator
MSITRVAKLAGVSSSTVSRVINRNPRVAPETEESVRSAMQRLNYTPSDRRPGPKPKAPDAGSLKTAAFLVFGASGDEATPAFADLLRGVSMAASDNAISVTFNYVPDLGTIPNHIIDESAHGLLLHGTLPEAALERKLSRLPTVWLMGNRARPHWGDQVMPDGFAAGHIAAEYLTRQGHRHLAFLNLDQQHWSFRLYFHGLSCSAADMGATAIDVEQPDEPAVGYWHRYGPRAVEGILDRYLALKPRPTGLFVADAMQVALIQPALQARGIKLGPGATQLVACNNESPFLAGLSPRPAVIDIRVESIGRQGIEQLLWRSRHPNLSERLLTSLEPRLILPE